MQGLKHLFWGMEAPCTYPGACKNVTLGRKKLLLRGEERL
jgi:hypothetical protein